MRSDYNNSQGGLLCNTTKDTSYNSEKSTQKETFEIVNCQVRVCVCRTQCLYCFIFAFQTPT